MREFAHLEVENRIKCVKYFWKEPGLRPGEQAFIGSFVAAIKEAILLFVVAVQITENGYTSRLHGRGPHVLFKEVDFRMHDWIRIAPPSIQINSS